LLARLVAGCFLLVAGDVLVCAFEEEPSGCADSPVRAPASHFLIRSLDDGGGG